VILPPSEIKTLTGYVRASAQVRWLRQHGWRFTVNALGQPIVAQGEFDRHLIGSAAARTQQPNFDWDAINGTNKKAG
jgi:hypothetical protein